MHQKRIAFKDALAQTLKKDEFCIVSHRWMDKEEPDSDGTQLKAIQQYLSDHKEVKYVWFDYCCMPQGAKTPSEKVHFKWMLENINILYLGVNVLILVDLSYFSRFWTQYEAWLSMQTATEEGLRPATVDARRYKIVGIYNTNDSMTKGLEDIWANKNPAQAFETLSKPDVTVTNKSDKEDQLPKIWAIDGRVRDASNNTLSVVDA